MKIIISYSLYSGKPFLVLQKKTLLENCEEIFKKRNILITK